jgi:hypothetical protein
VLLLAQFNGLKAFIYNVITTSAAQDSMACQLQVKSELSFGKFFIIKEEERND